MDKDSHCPLNSLLSKISVLSSSFAWSMVRFGFRAILSTRLLARRGTLFMAVKASHKPWALSSRVVTVLKTLLKWSVNPRSKSGKVKFCPKWKKGAFAWENILRNPAWEEPVKITFRWSLYISNAVLKLAIKTSFLLCNAKACTSSIKSKVFFDFARAPSNSLISTNSMGSDLLNSTPALSLETPALTLAIFLAAFLILPMRPWLLRYCSKARLNLTVGLSAASRKLK